MELIYSNGPVNRLDIEEALRKLLADLDYDLHKAIESNEETGEDEYPVLSQRLLDWIIEAQDV
jgi:hypothetical protein